MKLAIVFSVLNQFPLARHAINSAMQNLSAGSDASIIIIDNGSDVPFDEAKELLVVSAEKPTFTVSTWRSDKNIGVYPTIWEGLRYARNADVIAYFHSDLIVTEKDWDKRVLAEFEARPGLGLLGFIGSNEIDAAGGRGLGTTSNFQGGVYTESDGRGDRQTWKGSPAYQHGAVFDGFTPAAVVDGCAMIFRRNALEQITQRKEFPVHHFYDKLLSCQVREYGYSMGTLGIECDHISGQTVNQEPKYELMAQEWCEAHGIAKTHNWDDAVYHEAERQWLKEYRDEKHLIPVRV